ncbi:MAG: hypothetical protein R3C40_03275 [Parvularculaceae bacterium]
MSRTGVVNDLDAKIGAYTAALEAMEFRKRSLDILQRHMGRGQ